MRPVAWLVSVAVTPARQSARCRAALLLDLFQGKTGSRTIGRVGRHIHAIVRPPIAWAVAIIVGFGAGWLTRWRLFPRPCHAFGLAAGYSGSLLHSPSGRSGQFAEQAPFETNKPTTLIVTNGPFRFVRIGLHWHAPRADRHRNRL